MSPRRNNTSGVVGLRLYLKRQQRGRPTWRVQASWRSGGQLHSTEYSVDAHGPLRATELAILARERGMGTVMGLSARGAWARLRAGLDAQGQRAAGATP